MRIKINIKDNSSQDKHTLLMKYLYLQYLVEYSIYFHMTFD